MSQSPSDSIYILLHELYLESPVPKNVFLDNSYQSLLACGISWKALADVIETIKAADERFYLRSLDNVYRQDYIAVHLNRVNLTHKIHLPSLLEALFFLDLFWHPHLEFESWLQRINMLEDSLRFRLAHQGVDLSLLKKALLKPLPKSYNLEKQVLSFANNEKNVCKKNSAAMSTGDITNFACNNIKTIINTIQTIFQKELRVSCDAREFFYPSAHVLYQVLEGNGKATPFTLALITQILLLRLDIPVFGLNYPRSSLLKIQLQDQEFFLETGKDMRMLTSLELRQESVSLPIKTNRDYLEVVPYLVLIKKKIAHLQVLCAELGEQEKLKYLETLEQNIVS